MRRWRIETSRLRALFEIEEPQMRSVSITSTLLLTTLLLTALFAAARSDHVLFRRWCELRGAHKIEILVENHLLVPTMA